jgi:hypothetical protein
MLGSILLGLVLVVGLILWYGLRLLELSLLITDLICASLFFSKIVLSLDLFKPLPSSPIFYWFEFLNNLGPSLTTNCRLDLIISLEKGLLVFYVEVVNPREKRLSIPFIKYSDIIFYFILKFIYTILYLIT